MKPIEQKYGVKRYKGMSKKHSNYIAFNGLKKIKEIRDTF